jgi:flavodoxin
MKTVLVYDSIFGNTEKIARAIGKALESHGEVEQIRVGDAQPGHFDQPLLFRSIWMGSRPPVSKGPE